jgi:hypothetical protein
MEIVELNELICDHLRHYNLRVAAKVVEEEIKRIDNTFDTNK